MWAGDNLKTYERVEMSVGFINKKGDEKRYNSLRQGSSLIN
jgi:hypothetical protein